MDQVNAVITEVGRGYVRLELDDRTATVSSEMFLPGHGSPDLIVYPNSWRWEDGSPMSDEERQALWEDLTASAQQHNLTVERADSSGRSPQ